MKIFAWGLAVVTLGVIVMALGLHEAQSGSITLTVRIKVIVGYFAVLFGSTTAGIGVRSQLR